MMTDEIEGRAPPFAHLQCAFVADQRYRAALDRVIDAHVVLASLFLGDLLCCRPAVGRTVRARRDNTLLDAGLSNSLR